MAAINFVALTAYWGSDEADSTIKLSAKKWNEIRAGAQLEKDAWSYYEGQRFRVVWLFGPGQVTIDGEDGLQCVVGLAVDELIVNPILSGSSE